MHDDRLTDGWLPCGRRGLCAVDTDLLLMAATAVLALVLIRRGARLAAGNAATACVLLVALRLRLDMRLERRRADAALDRARTAKSRASLNVSHLDGFCRRSQRVMPSTLNAYTRVMSALAPLRPEPSLSLS
jgi:hypothetical protein